VKSILRSLGYGKLPLFLVDLFVLNLVAFLILGTRWALFNYPIGTNEALFFILSSIMAIPVFREFHLYKHKIFSTGAAQIVNIGKGMLWVGILEVVAIFLVKDIALIGYSRQNILMYIFGSWLAIAAVRVGLFRPIHRKIYGTGVTVRRIVAVGAGRAGQSLATRLFESPELGLSLVGFVDDDWTIIGKRLLGKRIYGPVANIATIGRELQADEIYVAINSIKYDRLLEIIEICRQSGIPVTVTTNHFRIIHDKIGTSEFDFIDSLTLRPRGLSSASRLLKRSVDLVGSLILLTLLSPFLLAISIAVKMTSEGPVFYRSQVVGKDGKLFTWFKFRTMVVNRVETVHREHLRKIITENATTQKLQNEPRITNVGRFLRKYSLDELPQLFNVLRGEMSLIGPRPCLQYEYEHFDDWHKQRFDVIPGMTGLWQVFGRNRSDVTFNDSIILDLYYIQNYSLWLDIKIVLKTIPTVLFGRGGA
jgi:undecaprenyl-phosphate galactose phosphotransferase